MTTRLRGRVDGVVQGVGFRPHAYRLASELALGGFVLNDERGVVLEVEGEEGAVEAFRLRLGAEAPPLAVVESVDWRAVTPAGERAFAIRTSARAGEASAPVAADAATCDACLAELWDPANRRYRYPFVNCTDCGPRLTIVEGVPYDRARTTMAGFTLCDACRAEYEDPTDRRYHAEPNACPVCGPQVWIRDVVTDDPIRHAAHALAGGAIVAVKGLGGYHLACRADDEAAVARLRARKHREEKPFALMARDLAAAWHLVHPSDAAGATLTSRERPIVVAPRRPDARVAAAVAPRSADLGVMLPYTPLHHLLLADAGGPLVMTSGNVSDEPIAFHDDDAHDRLAPIADLFLVNDRPIRTRVDDSVVRGPVLLRRSRGHAPAALPLPVAARRPVLAVGAEQKNAFCLAKGGRAWLGHHIGDLENLATLEAFEDGIAHFQRLFDVRPEVVAHDLHPEYLSTKHAMDLDGVELVAVQHHHAHLAAVLAEYGVTGPAAGAIYDGTGLGTDGTIWGGEILVGDLRGFERVAHLHPVRLPGGAAAVREPWRMACAWLLEAGAEPPPALVEAAGGRWDAVSRLARSELAPVTTSIGRLFDAVAAIAGVRTHASYEGQAAVELEALASGIDDAEPYEMDALDPRPMIRALTRDIIAGADRRRVAAAFHATIARATAAALAATGAGTRVVAGGVFANRLLLERLPGDVLVPRRVPVNDGGIAYGQAAIAAAAT
ncbi:MAG: hydrogenase maturation protein HypF [Solirubrobacteraceae bacterium]|nr:hydrogenase maturation protein HypF [Solirubrobacteraceae bacterium]